MNNETLGGNDLSQQKPENGPIQPMILSSREEQEAVFNALYGSLIADTRSELYGTLTDEAIMTNDTLRGVIKALAVNLGKVEKISPQGWLSIGVTDFIPQKTLHEWSLLTDAEASRLFQAAARYFERQNTQKR